jgi:heme/copper-type cytochrome/quinol oxidase subunit 2
MGPFRRYLLTMVVALLALQTIAGFLDGQGLAALAGAVFGLIWTGWLVILVGLPLFVMLLWALPRAYQRLSATPRPVVGMVTGLAIWALAATVLGSIGVLVTTPGPGAMPPTALTILGFGLVVGAFGALLGLLEARAS